jgi:hypothetical protein
LNEKLKTDNMKKYILLVAVILGTTAISFGQTKSAKKKEVKAEVVQPAKYVGDASTPITFKTVTIDRKDIAYGKNDFFSFQFTNTGVEPIVITGVRTSCGCTKAVQPESAVAPGETAEIAVTYDTKRVGAFTKTITVTTDKTEPLILTISGNVLADENATEEKVLEVH